MKSKKEFKEKCQKQILRQEKEKEHFKESLEIAKLLECEDEDIIDLNIGGTEILSTTKKTLTKYKNSALGIMFSGNHNLQKHNGRIFIDRDGKTFKLLIQYLRNGKIPIFEDEKQKQNFNEECDYWQIPINDNNNINKSPFLFDSNWCAETLNIENNGKIIKKQNGQQHGIVFCSPGMDKNNSYIEFKVIINVPYRGKSHLFLGLVNKKFYKYEHLLSTFWKDSPSSFYWDVWNTKLIKTDDNGIQVGTYNGYGCSCEECETKFGIRYDYRMKTIEFFKNNANLGVAFRNVPEGLSPALDIWFESGQVEILNNTQPNDNLFL